MRAPDGNGALLEVTNLTKHFLVRRGALGWSTGVVRAVDAVSFQIPAGSTLGLVGESGCGKTTTSKLILALETPTAGSIRFENREVVTQANELEYARPFEIVFVQAGPCRVHNRIADKDNDRDQAGRVERERERRIVVADPTTTPAQPS